MNLDPQMNLNSTLHTIRKAAPTLLQRLQHGLSYPPIELIYTPHTRWPLPHDQGNQLAHRPLRISILDASFNPPTLAHLALANSPRPVSLLANERSSKGCGNGDYDAKLLLLSVKNADKMLKPGDATYVQRLEMMSLLSQNVVLRTHSSHPAQSTPSSQPSTTGEATNVAIAIIDEPTFVGKSQALLEFLKKRFTHFSPPSPWTDLELTFLVGMDTLERLFSPRYYPSESDMMGSLRRFLSPAPNGDGSRIVCAQRVSTPDNSRQPADKSQEANAMELAKEFVDMGRISIIDLEDDVSTYSSSAIRGAISKFGLEKGGDEESWRGFVTKGIGDYIVEQKLYVSHRQPGIGS